MIDWQRIAELRNEIGPDDFGDVVGLFLEEVEEEIAALRQGGDAAQIERRLHMLKGSALNLGFTTFGALCGQGEATAARGPNPPLDLTETLASYDASKAEFLFGLARL